MIGHVGRWLVGQIISRPSCEHAAGRIAAARREGTRYHCVDDLVLVGHGLRSLDEETGPMRQVASCSAGIANGYSSTDNERYASAIVNGG
jgi:hypothetical protein